MEVGKLEVDSAADEFVLLRLSQEKERLRESRRQLKWRERQARLFAEHESQLYRE